MSGFSFEHGPTLRQTTGEESEAALLEREVTEQIALIDSISPSGDPIADLRHYESVTSDATSPYFAETREDAIRAFLHQREAFLTKWRVDSTTPPVPARIRPRILAALDRLLDYYDAGHQSLADFNSEHR